MDQSSLQPKKLKNASVTILNEVLRVKAKLDEDLVKENNAILKSFLETFIPEMKKHDKIFESIYQKIYYTGSYYSDLRVSKPDEYDLNLQLKLPFKAQYISVEYQPQVPSYVKYKITDESIITRENGLIKLFENKFLIPDKVRLWIQSVVDKALKTYQRPSSIAQVKCSASGPARTIILIKKDGTQIDIDLVPAIECSINSKPLGIDDKVFAKVSKNRQCFLVPKPYQPPKQSPVNEAERARLWRAHYPEAERSVIHDLGCVKPLIKLLKLLRDKENWKILASYYLKTVVMWMIIQNSSKESWKMDHLGDKFLEALKNLQSFVERRQIRYFFSSKYNLLEKLSVEQASNIQNRLRIIIRDTERDDAKLWDIFGCPRTFQVQNQTVPVSPASKSVDQNSLQPKTLKNTSVQNQSLPVSPDLIINQNSLQPSRLRNAPVTILNEILRVKAKLDEDLVKENNAILRSFLDTFIPEMKTRDKLFDLVYQKIFYTGSYYSDLRVSKPDEYDLNLQLKLPFKPQYVSVEYQSQVPSYVKYRITDESIITTENGLNKLFENGFLIPNKVRLWIQSVVDKALKTYQRPSSIAQIKCSASGPARTLFLIKRDGTQIDIDLVPAIECSINSKPPGIDGRVHAKVSGKLQCFLIPKPYQPPRQSPVNEAERARLWRAHYPNAEQSVIHDLGCVKPLIKLLKLLRDKENWKILASYYLKTIVMWMLIEDSSTESWKMNHLGDKFMEALRTLQSDVENRKIRYFFSSKYNLLEKLSAEQAHNIQRRLHFIIRDIERDNENLWDIFQCPRTFQVG